MDVDYLVVGAGATAMAFVDVILSETEATVAMVDRRDAPGGHWNDAYPFVRLHQSSSFYGVPSRALGQGGRVTRGYNAGMTEMASKPEILHYYHDLMETHFLPSGRVQYFPLSESLGDGKLRSLLTGKTTQLTVRRKVVNAGLFAEKTTIPSTHTPTFEVSDGVAFVPVNDLPRCAPEHDQFTVIGAGKTAMDAVLWLLSNDVDPERISWVRAHDYWIFKRDSLMPDPAFFTETITCGLNELRSLASAKTVKEHVENMEKTGLWHRIDPDHWPTRFHAAVCSVAEVAALAQVKRVHRMGYVRAITPDKLILEHGQVPHAGRPLFVDCSAHGGAVLGGDVPPVFEAQAINMVMVRPFQPAFSAALIGYLEATIEDDAVKNAMTRMTDFHDTPAQFIKVQMAGYMNQHMWNQHPQVIDWVDRCRLNASSHLMAGLTPQDTEKLALLSQFGPLIKAAMENMPRMLAAGDTAS